MPRPNRKPLRLTNYNYASPGYYFVTVCVSKRIDYFGKIINGVMQLTTAGQIARDQWIALEKSFSNIQLDECIIMPDHMHGIIQIKNLNIFGHDESSPYAPPYGHDSSCPDNNLSCPNNDPSFPDNNVWPMMKNPEISLGKIIRHYKAKCARLIRLQADTSFQWHRNYYDRIIRNEMELHRIRRYIRQNPDRYGLD